MEHKTEASSAVTIGSYLRAVRQHIFWVLAVGVVCALAAGLYSLSLAERFQASSQVVMLPPFVTTNANQFETRQLSSLSIDAVLRNAETARRILEEARRNHGLLAEHFSADTGNALEDRASAIAALPIEAIIAKTGMARGDAESIGLLTSNEILAYLNCSSEDLASLSVESILGSLESSVPVETRMATETVFSPVIGIRCTQGRANVAIVIANQAARVLVRRYAEMTTERAQKSAAELEQQVAKEKESLAHLDAEIAAVNQREGSPNGLDREIYWADRAYGEAILKDPAGEESPEVRALVNRLRALQEKRDTARSRIDSLEMVKQVQVAALRTLFDTLAEVRFTPPARLKQLEMLSPAAPSARRIGPDRKRAAFAGAATGLAVSLAGIFLMLLVRSPALKISRDRVTK